MYRTLKKQRQQKEILQIILIVVSIILISPFIIGIAGKYFDIVFKLFL
jgi:hypothetical protein